MVKQVVLRMLLIAGIVFVVIVVLGGIYTLFFSLPSAESAPMVIIHSPEHGAQVPAGKLVAVHSSVRDETHTIHKVELWSVREEILTLVEQTSLSEKDHSFSLSQGWQVNSPGSYRLIVRAYNDVGSYGEAAVDVSVVEKPEEAASPVLEEDEMLPPMGGLEVGEPDAITVADEPQGGGPGGGPEGLPIEPPQSEPAPEPPPQFGGLVLQGLLDIFTPAPLYTFVEVEGLDFEVEQLYSGVYCYASLASYPTERVPATGYFDTSSQFHWDIEEYLGGDNSVVVTVFVDQPLEIQLSCHGVRSNNEIANLGLLEMTHPPEDWNGQVIQASGSGGEGFTISYRINPEGSDLEAPTQLHQISLNQQDHLHWLWDGAPDEIDGFRIYRNDALVGNVSATARLFPMEPWWTVPPCAEEYRYHVVAYHETVESPPSNFLYYQGPVCDMANDIEHISSQPTCDGAGQKLFVKYDNGSPPGFAFIGARFLSEGQVVPGILSTRPTIIHGPGTVQIIAQYHGVETFTTDEVLISMMDLNDQPFYVEAFNETINWSAGSPDLTIESAVTDWDNNVLQIQVKNSGCARAEASYLSILRDSDGQTGLMEVPKIEAKSSSLIILDIQPDEVGLWGGEVALEVDPFNTVPESNENNNEYRLSSVRFQSVQFYGIHIHNDHDANSKGEWVLYFEVTRIHAGVWEIPLETSISYTWGTGYHDINNLFFSPALEDNDPLLIKMWGKENDGPLNAVDVCGRLAVYNSPDGSLYPILENNGYVEIGSWKDTQEFAVTSDSGDYTIYYRIILDR